MPTKFSSIESQSRIHLEEPIPKFWSSLELINIITAGVRDLWRDIVDLKGEHFLTIDTTSVSLPANSSQFIGVPTDVHKIYMVEPTDITDNATNGGLIFKPQDYNHPEFQSARTRGAIDPRNDVILYSITSQGGPVGAPIIRVAPTVTSAVSIAFSYIPTLGSFTSDSIVPIPGEADNALIAWCVSYARAKEREDRAPDANWLAVYATEKSHLLQSLGLRQYQEPSTVDAFFEPYW